MELLSPAKINLWLRILGRMPDGFHEVETRLCKISIADTVSLELKGKGSKIDLTCNIPGIPLDDSNLAVKALRAFEASTGKSHSWSIH